jgi:hypothetical protein
VINGEDLDFGWWRRDTDWLPKEFELSEKCYEREEGGMGGGREEREEEGYRLVAEGA